MDTVEIRQTSNEIKVWDPVVRIFHWTLVVVFAIAWLTGDEESQVHVYSGYVVVCLLFIRIIWGFMGTRYARFSDFVYRPSIILGYAKDFLYRKPERYLGHNPIGGLMVIALLASLFAAGLSGLAVQGIEDGSGPFAFLSAGAGTAITGVVAESVADDDGDHQQNEAAEGMWKELHEFFANLTLLLVAFHVVGVIIGSLVHRENLVRAMITGRKTV